MPSWYIESGMESDVVFSSRVRLARNLREFPFPTRMNKEQSAKVIEKVKEAVTNSSEWAKTNLKYIGMNELSPIDKYTLMEKHLISPNIIESKLDTGVLVSNDEKISIMINEEDHLRIQCMGEGLQLEQTYDTCVNIDRLINETIEFAFNNNLGYLTSCPTNLGTGIRFSIMLHLPALTMTGYINGVLDACSKIGIAVRGIYGENSEASGNMFQISNQVTLGLKEEEIMASVKGITSKIIDQERAIRRELYQKEPNKIEDKIYRALGTLGSARIISNDESMKLLSDVRLGVEMGIIKDIPIETINKIMLDIQPATLQKLVVKEMLPEERDVERANLVRKLIANKV